MPFSGTPRPCWGGVQSAGSGAGARACLPFPRRGEGGEPASHPAPSAARNYCPGGSARTPRRLARCRDMACPPFPACPGRCPAPWAPGRGRPRGGVGYGMLLLRCLLHSNASGGCCSPGAGWHGGSHPCGDSHTTDVTPPDGAPAGFGGCQPPQCLPTGTAVWGCRTVCICQAADAGVKHFAAGVLWSSRCFDVGVGFWHVPVLSCGLATSRCVAQAPGGLVGSVTGYTHPKILGDSGQESARRRDNVLAAWNLGGWHPLPVVCDGCGRILVFCLAQSPWCEQWGFIPGVCNARVSFTPHCLFHRCWCETGFLHL